MHLFDARLGRIRLLADLRKFILKLPQLQVGKPIEVDHMIPCAADRADELVQLQVNSFRVPVLRVLIRNTIRKVTIVVPVLMISCHVSE